MSDLVYLIDTYSLIFQVFHAIPPMTSPTGQPTNALFGISRDLVTILKQHRPGWIVCAWESDEPGVRYEIYPQYKANRSSTPEDLAPQIPRIRELIEAFGIPIVSAGGWEADDVIATLTQQGLSQDAEVRIVTSDKDARQLLGPRVHLYNLRKRTSFGEAELLTDWGVRPDQVVDFQSLVGDAVDNVPGVPLVGPKKAAQLLQQFGTLEAVLAHADEAPGAKLRENLKTYADQALVSRRLVRLNTELSLGFDWQAARGIRPDVPRLVQLFREFGFRKLIDDVRAFGGAEALEPDSAPAKPAAAKRPSKSLFDEDPVDSAEPPVSPPDAVPSTPHPASALRAWQVIDTPDQLASLADRLRRVSRVCVDLETTHVDPRRATIVGWAICWQPGEAFYLPVQGPPGSKLLDPQHVVDTLKPILERPELELVNQNIKYDLIVLRTVGIEPTRLGLDPMVGDYLLDAGARTHNLEVLIDKYLQRPSIPISQLIGTGKQQKSMAEVAIPAIAEYASEDADAALQIADLIAAQLREAGLWDLYWDLERPLIPILADMEYTGIRVDADELRRQSAALTEQLATLMVEIHDLAGREFNIDSPLQLRTILFDELKLPIKKKTKTGASTDQEVLEELALLHPLPAKIIEHRQATKLKGTYLDALPDLVHPATGRIHCSFNQVVAATGRLSSSDPNLQNIPIRTPAGRQVRKAFLPRADDWRLLCADYSQIELRMLAHFSQDEVLLDAFARGHDIHTAVAADVYGVAPTAVDPEMRRVAKAVNFGVLYGQSAFGLSAALGIPQDQAARFIEEYFARYSGVTRFLEQILDDCVRTGYATTILGRRRRIEGIRSERNRNRTMPERTAINTVIQGSAADLIKRAMIDVTQALTAARHPAKLLLQIHDELVFETPADAVSSLATIVRDKMRHALPLNVPLDVVLSVGPNWLETTDLPD